MILLQDLVNVSNKFTVSRDVLNICYPSFHVPWLRRTTPRSTSPLCYAVALRYIATAVNRSKIFLFARIVRCGWDLDFSIPVLFLFSFVWCTCKYIFQENASIGLYRQLRDVLTQVSNCMTNNTLHRSANFNFYFPLLDLIADLGVIRCADYEYVLRFFLSPSVFLKNPFM